MSLTYPEIKEMMNSELNESVLGHIIKNYKKWDCEVADKVLDEVYDGQHQDITEKLSHLAKIAVATSLTYKIENNAVRHKLDAYFTSTEDDLSTVTTLDEKIGKEDRIRLIGKLLDELEENYNKPSKNDHDFIARRFKNGISYIKFVLETLRDASLVVTQ